MNDEPLGLPPAPSAKKKRGCLFWAVVAIVVVGCGGYLAFRYAMHRIVAAYTEATPLDLGGPAVAPAELGGLHGRIAAFAHGLRNKTPIAPLVLTGEELTALVVGSPAFQKLGGQARFSIGEDEIHGDLSVPLERMGYPDRWFNGSAIFKATLENGVLAVTLDSASVKGQPLPGWIVDQLRRQNLAKDLYEQPQNAALIARLESIEVGNGRIMILPRLRR